MDKKEILLILSSINVIYLIIIYSIFTVLIGKTMDILFIHLFNDNNESKYVIRLVIESAIQLAITAVVCFGCRKIINKIPFPLNFNGYKQLNINDFSNKSGIMWSTFVLLFEHTLIAKLKLIQIKITNF